MTIINALNTFKKSSREISTYKKLVRKDIITLKKASTQSSEQIVKIQNLLSRFKKHAELLNKRIVIMKHFYKKHKFIKFFTHTLLGSSSILNKAIKQREIFKKIVINFESTVKVKQVVTTDAKRLQGNESTLKIPPTQELEIEPLPELTEEIDNNPTTEILVDPLAIRKKEFIEELSLLFVEKDRHEAQQIAEGIIFRKFPEDTRLVRIRLHDLSKFFKLTLGKTEEDKNFIEAILFGYDDPKCFISAENSIKKPEISEEQFAKKTAFLNDFNARKKINAYLYHSKDDERARIFQRLTFYQQQLAEGKITLSETGWLSFLKLKRTDMSAAEIAESILSARPLQGLDS